MKIVILAAGKGSRLGNEDTPKALTMLANGSCIMEQQLSTLLPWVSPRDIIVVVGFHMEMIMEKFPELTYVENPNFATENTAKSLLCAIADLDDDLLWINGDVVCHPVVVRQMLSSGLNSIAVTEGEVGDEEVKYRCDCSGRIVSLSKELVGAFGEAVGINSISRRDLPTLRRKLAECAKGSFFEKGIEEAIAEGVEFWPLTIEGGQCIEIDFSDDLERANQMMEKWL